MIALEIIGGTVAALSALFIGWALIAQRREIDRQTERADAASGQAWKLQLALVGIQLATQGGKSRTSIKINRMAADALGVE